MRLDSLADNFCNTWIKCFRHNEIFVDLIIGYESSKCFGGSQLHFFGNLFCVSFQRTFENTRECDYVVYLIREKRIASLFIEETISGVTIFGAETPTKMSAPFSASASVPLAFSRFVTSVIFFCIQFKFG